jgi:hypothetical protein
MELAEAARDEAAFATSVLRQLACGGGDANLMFRFSELTIDLHSSFLMHCNYNVHPK